MTEAILSYNSGQITAQRRKTTRTLVDDISFTIGQRESLALIGETGSGKTMTALSIMGMLPQNVIQKNGRIIFCGKELSATARFHPELGIEMVYIPQNGMEFLNPSRKVKDQLYDNLEKLNIPRNEMKGAAIEKLKAAGLWDAESFMEKYPFQLSGGEAQRVTIAISSCSHARLLIADEPTNGLDPEAKERFLHHIDTLFPDAARLFITHDITIASLCDRILILCGGKFIESGDAAAVLLTPRHPYTQALQAALVENGMKETPILRDGESDCPFYSRCPKGCSDCIAGIPIRREEDHEWRCIQ